jgi:Ca2+-binding EF-hand superfamily protein
MDKNHDGRLPYQKMKQALNRLCGDLSAVELRSIFNAFDLDCVGSVDYVEFARRLLMRDGEDDGGEREEDSKRRSHDIWTEEERVRHLQRPTEAMELRKQTRERSAKSNSFHEKDTEAVSQNLAKGGVSNFTPHEGAFVSSLRSQHEEGHHHAAFGSSTSTNRSPTGKGRKESLWMEEKQKNEKLYKRSLKKVSTLIEDVETEDSLRSLFESFDRNQDQRISMDEFKASLSKVQLTDPESRALFKHYDQDNNGTISFDEFARGVESAVAELRKKREAKAKKARKDKEKRAEEDKQRRRPLTTEERVSNYLTNKFESLDGNSDGVLTDSELESLAKWAFHLTKAAESGDTKAFEAFKSELLGVCTVRGKKKKQMDCKTFVEVFKPMFIRVWDDGEKTKSKPPAMDEMPPPPPRD